MRDQVLLRVWLLAVVVTTATACTASKAEPANPELAPRGQTMTTAKLTRQDLTNKVSLSGKVTMNPVFGLVAPVDGQMRYAEVKPVTSTPTTATRIGSVWASGRPNFVDIPAGTTFAGRLVDDKSTVTAGMPIVSGKYVGYGIVADIDGAQAYKITNAVASVQAQIKNGPGPFACTVLGTIAALPPGTIPEPAQVDPQSDPGANTKPTAPSKPVPPGGGKDAGGKPSEPTGLRLVCIAPADVKLINGAAANLEVVTDNSPAALVLPVEAVAGSQGAGKVDVVGVDGRRQTRDVVLGLTDGKVVEITSGLTGDETVAMPGPNLPAGSDADGKGNGPTGSK